MKTFFNLKPFAFLLTFFLSHFALKAQLTLTPNVQNMVMCQSGGNGILTAPGGFLHYEWFQIDQSGNFINVQSGAGNVIEVTALGIGRAGYFALAYDNLELNNPVTVFPVTVNVKPDITPVLKLNSVCAGEVYILAGENNEVYKTYTWSDGTTSTVTNTPTSPLITQTGTYTLQVEDYAGCTATASINIDINNISPSIDIIPAGPTEICQGSSLKLISSIRNSSYTYKWFRNGSQITFYPSTASEILVYDEASYYLEVSTTSDVPCLATSNTIDVTYQSVTRPVISVSGSTSIQCGQQVTLSVPAIYSSYQWRKGSVSIPTATSETFVATEPGNYSVWVSNGLCTVSSLNAIPVTVINPTIDVSGLTDFVCGTQQTTLSVPTSHSTYIWMVNGTNIQSGPSSSYTVINRGGSYQVRVTDGTCSAVSNPVSINVTNNVPKPEINISGEPVGSELISMCPGGDPLTATTGYFLYEWRKNNVVVSSGTSNQFHPDQTAAYSVQAFDSDGCFNTSDVKSVLVSSSTPPIYVLGAEICGNSSTISTDEFYKEYAWSNGVTSQENQIEVFSPGNYFVTVTDYANCQYTTDVVFVTSATPTDVPVISSVGSAAICEGSNVKLKLDNTMPSSGTFILRWKKNNSDIVLTGVYPQTTVSGFTLPTGQEFEATEAGTYTLEITEINSLFDPNPVGWTPSHCFGTSNSITINVLPKPVAPVAEDTYNCGPGSITIMAQGLSGTTGYKWYDQSMNILSGYNSSSLTTGYMNELETRYFYVSAIDGNGCESNLKSIFVQALRKPLKPENLSFTHCGPGMVPIFILGSPASKYRVYDAPVAGNLLQESTSEAFETIYLSASTKLYVSAVLEGLEECESERAEITIDILQAPAISPATVCQYDIVTLTPNGNGSTGSYKYKWFGSPTGGFPLFTSSLSNPSITFPATSTQTFYVAIATTNSQCETSRTPVTVTVNPLPNASVLSTNSPICSGSTAQVNLALTGTPPYSITYGVNGVYNTVNNISSSIYSTSTILNTSNQITVTEVTDGNGCTNIVWLHPNITVNPVTPVSFTGLSSSYCENPNQIITLTPNVGGGTFSGSGVSGNAFTPSNVGSYNVTYTYINNVNCPSSYSVPVTVHSLPVADFTTDMDLCLNDPASIVQVTPSGGTLSGTGISFNSIDNNYYFTPSAVGTHAITYSVTDANGCSDSEQKDIVVYDLPVVSFSGLNASYCEFDPEVGLIGSPSNGVFLGSGIVNGTDFDPASAGTGNHTIIYNYTDANGCSNSESHATVVNALPSVDFAGLNSSYCLNSSTTSLSPTPWGGTFSGTGINGTTFNPAQAGQGTHSITYTYTDNATGCTNSINKQVQVNSLPVIDFTLNTTYCQNQSISLAGNPTGGTFSGSAVSGTTFNPTWSGSFTITYSYTDPGTTCSNSVTKTTTVNPKPAIYYSTGGSRCGAGQVLLTMDPISSPNVYRWFDGLSNLLQESSQNTFLTPSINATTNYSVKLFNTATGCESDPITSTAVVNQLSAPVVNGPVSGICPATSFTLTASGGVSDYLWYAVSSGGTPIGWGSTLTVSGGISSSVTYYVSTIDYINSPYNCESPRTPFTVNVIPIGTPSITQTVNCQSTVLTVTGGISGDVYNWFTDASENTPVYTSVQPTFDLALPNIYLTNRFYVQIQNASCSSVRAAVDVQFKEQPVPPSSVQGATRCGPGEVTLYAYGAPGGMRYQWYTTPTGGVPVYESLSSSFSVNVTSTTTYYVGIKNTMGCVSGIRTPVTATISSLGTPVVSDQTIIGGGAVTLTATGATGPNQSYRWYHPIDKSIGEGPDLYYYFTNTTTLYVAIVDYSYSDGCIGPKVPVNLIADGTFSINTDNASICFGESATLEAPSGYIYQWSGGGIDVTSAQPIQVSPTVTTTYTAREVNSNITSQITITVMNCTPSGALLYDGADDLVEVNDEGRLNLGTGPFTMEALIRSDRLTSQGIQVILSKRNSSETDGFLFGLWSDGHLWIQCDGAPNIGYDQGPTILDGQCHHVAITRDTLFNLKFYIDGNLTYQTASGRDIGSVGGLRIGRNNFTGLYFDGLIGEVRVWDYERTQAQLQNEVNIRLNPQTGLLAYYVMEDGEGSQVLSDLSGNNNHGRLGSSTGLDGLDPVWVNGPFSCTVQGNFKASFAESQQINNDTLSSVKSVRAYPNPFQNQTTLFIEGEATSGKVTLVITDLNGIEIARKEEVNVNEEIPMGADLRSGVYFVQVISESKVETLRLIKTE